MSEYRQHAATVYERDAWICKLCDLPVAKDRTAPHPLSPSLDHVTPQVLGGGHDPENLQTAHLRCNESKHMRPERGSTLRVELVMPPELQELVRRLVPKEEADPENDLPPLAPETIGDAFDAAERMAMEEQLRDLPGIEQLRSWALGQHFVSEREADGALMRELYGCLHEEQQCDRLRRRLVREQPEAWFIAKFLMEGEGPGWLADEDGWEEVAQALLDYIGFEALEGLKANVLEVPQHSDPLELLAEARAGAQVEVAPGLYLGHPVYAYEEAVRALKASDRLLECEELLQGLIAATELDALAEGGSLSPHFYEQMAIVRRKLGNDLGEREILERYFLQPGALDSASLRRRLDSVNLRLIHAGE